MAREITIKPEDLVWKDSKINLGIWWVRDKVKALFGIKDAEDEGFPIPMEEVVEYNLNAIEEHFEKEEARKTHARQRGLPEPKPEPLTLLEANPPNWEKKKKKEGYEFVPKGILIFVSLLAVPIVIIWFHPVVLLWVLVGWLFYTDHFAGAVWTFAIGSLLGMIMF